MIGGGSCNQNDPDKKLSRKPTLEMRTSSDSAGETSTVASRSSAERTVTADTPKAGTATRVSRRVTAPPWNPH